MGRAFEYRRAAKEKRWDKMSKVFPKLAKAIQVAARDVVVGGGVVCGLEGPCEGVAGVAGHSPVDESSSVGSDHVSFGDV